MDEKVFRNKVSWMMFLFSILVIWVHAYNVDLFAQGLSGASWILADQVERFLSETLGQTAVPGFFMISACLFFRGFSWEKLAGKWKGRLFSIVIPYVVWNLLYYLGYVLAARLPGIQAVVGKGAIPFSAAEAAAAILAYRYAPIFWYLFQLILLIILSPLIYLLVKEKRIGIIYLALLLWAGCLHLDTQHPNTDALFYYSFAAYAAVHGKRFLEGAWKRSHALLGVLFLALAAGCFWNMGHAGAGLLWLWTVLYRLSLPAAVWLLLKGDWLAETRPWMRQSLFLYAIHYVVVRLVNKGSALILTPFLGPNARAAAAVGIYLALPAVVVAVSYWAALFLGRWLPQVWKVLSGGRKLKE